MNSRFTDQCSRLLPRSSRLLPGLVRMTMAAVPLPPTGKDSAEVAMNKINFKRLTDYLVGLGVEQVSHTNKSYLAHLIGVYRLMESCGCSEELCRAGMFHSIYGTEMFQRFGLPLEPPAQVRALLPDLAHRLAYL